jgi:hypothetical protein
MLEPQPILFGDEFVILGPMYYFAAITAKETPFLPFRMQQAQGAIARFGC